MVAIKDAVAKAVQFAASVLDPARTQDIRLEEVEMGEHKGEEVWLITLSMPIPTAISEVLGGRRSRDFKTFTVHKETGEVLSMKIRELAGA